ncbi:MAG: hypothetical protein ACOYLB_10210 [Phototrophicaceae bacterium]
MSSIFSQDWRDCLDAHYRDVVQRGDTLTESSLTMVLYQVGYREDELKEMKLYATMRTEDLQADFIPTLDIPTFPEEESVLTIAEATQPEEQVAPPDEPDVTPSIEDMEVLDELIVLEDLPSPDPLVDPFMDDEPDLPQQLSMF